MHDMTFEEQTRWATEATTVLEGVARFFKARAAMYAALYLNEYDPERLPPIAQEVERLLKGFEETKAEPSVNTIAV